MKMVLVVSIIFTSTAFAAVGSDIGTMIRVTLTNAAALIAKQVAEASAAIGTMVTSIGSFSMNTVGNITLNTNTMMGNLKVATAQNSQSAQTIAEVQAQASQKLATARQTIHMQDQLLKTIRKYGANGQGYKACTVVAENKGLDLASDQTKVLAAVKETETMSAIMPSSNLNANIYDQSEMSSSLFCAQGNPNCTASSVPNGNVNASLLFTSTSEGSKEQLARNQFRQNLLGVSIQAPINPTQVSSPNGQKGFYESNRQAALLSPAAYSLAYIDAQNTKSIDRDGTKYSANELIENTVSRYYGGAEAKDWQASMIAQEPRGLLVEAARLGGLTVWLNNHMYQQNLRKEANLAAILIATSTPLSEDVRKMGNESEAKAIRSSTRLYR